MIYHYCPYYGHDHMNPGPCHDIYMGPPKSSDQSNLAAVVQIRNPLITDPGITLRIHIHVNFDWSTQESSRGSAWYMPELRHIRGFTFTGSTYISALLRSWNDLVMIPILATGVFISLLSQALPKNHHLVLNGPYNFDYCQWLLRLAVSADPIY